MAEYISLRKNLTESPSMASFITLSWTLVVASSLVVAGSIPMMSADPRITTEAHGGQDDQRSRKITSPYRLDISNHNVTTIGDEELPHNVSVLLCKGNPLVSIADHAFNESFDTLQAIDIEHSLLKSFPVPALTNVTSLTSLTISHGPMSNIPDSDVTILPHLQYLDLSYNQLSDITNISILKGADKLYQIELGHNRLADISPLYDLQLTLRLNLVNNQIRNITPPAAIKPATLPAKLLYLWLTSNQMTSIPDLTFMPDLQVLELSSNNITNTNHDRFPASLLLLYINHNSLRWIPHAITNLPIIRQLDLNDNRIKTLDNFVFPSSLRTLNVQNNNIQQLHNLTFLNDSTHLATLGLSGNPLTLISSTAFSQLSQLHTLYLEKTSLTRLPLALLKLSQLKSLDMSNTTSLTCTCQESSLSPWAQHVTALKGSCDGAEIKYFLNTLAKQCPQQHSRRHNGSNMLTVSR